MIAFLPISRHNVAFELASGRPYSQFERLLLEAIGAGNDSLESLTHVFCMHRSVLITAMVTLVQAGWVGLNAKGGDTGYVITAAGKVALRTDGSLPADRRVTPRGMFVVVERVEGQIIKGGAVHFWSRETLNGQTAPIWNRGFEIPRSDIRHTPEQATVRPLIWANTDQGDYIKTIGPIKLFRDGSDFLPLKVDIDRGIVIGLPPSWEPRLTRTVVELCKQQRLRGSDNDDDADTLYDAQIAPFIRSPSNERLPALTIEDSGETSVLGEDGSDEERAHELEEKDAKEDGALSMERQWHPLDAGLTLLVGIDQHRQWLTNIIRQSEKVLIISSRDLSMECIDHQMPYITSALARGVNIDVIWSNPSHEESVDQNGLLRLREIEKASSGASIKGRLMVCKQASILHTGVVIGDRGGTVECAVGTHSWLGPNRPQAIGISVVLVGSPLVATICRAVSDRMADDPSLKYSRNDAFLDNRSGMLEVPPKNASKKGAAVYGRIIIGREHFGLRELDNGIVSENVNRAEVAVDVMRPESYQTAVSLAEKLHSVGCTESVFRYRDSRADNDSLKAISLLQQFNGRCEQKLRSMSYMAFNDGHVLITSMDMLQKQEIASRLDAVHLGICLRGEGVATQIRGFMKT